MDCMHDSLPKLSAHKQHTFNFMYVFVCWVEKTDNIVPRCDDWLGPGWMKAQSSVLYYQCLVGEKAHTIFSTSSWREYMQTYGRPFSFTTVFLLIVSSQPKSNRFACSLHGLRPWSRQINFHCWKIEWTDHMLVSCWTDLSRLCYGTILPVFLDSTRSYQAVQITHASKRTRVSGASASLQFVCG